MYYKYAGNQTASDFFGYNSYLFYFPMKVAMGHILKSSWGKPWSPPLNDSPVYGCLCYVILLVRRKCTCTSCTATY